MLLSVILPLTNILLEALKNLLQWYGGYEIFVFYDDLTGGTILLKKLLNILPAQSFLFRY